jgi:acyl-CoA dehydrogenase
MTDLRGETCVDAEERAAILATVRTFARREVGALVGTAGRDGNLGELGRVLGRAAVIGLVAGDGSEPGAEHGIWAPAYVAAGPRPALEILREIATACGGVAAAIHAAGLGAAEARTAGAAAAHPAVALLDTSWRLDLAALAAPPVEAARVTGAGARATLRGAASFVAEPPGCDAWVVYAARDGRWCRVIVPAGAAGLVTRSVGERTGLSALGLVDATFASVSVAVDARTAEADPRPYLTRLLLGYAAIAVGNAQGALTAARAYAGERVQGGARIGTYPAVRLLLGDAAARIEAARAQLVGASEPRPPGGALLAAAAAKLRVTDDCCHAVSDCLQVLGGYGYMEEYRLEKRLRDALVLKTIAVRPDDLRLLCEEQGGAEP